MTNPVDCLFCRMVAGEIPVEKVLETETCLAFKDIAPQAPTHSLVVHKIHTPCLAESEAKLLGELMNGVREAAQALSLKNFRVVINNGAGVGQTIFHTHAHLLAGRPMTWPPG